ncbi:archease [Burkholderia diffusa]|uniref:archease n=1 Tax=Burkholderia diffusa TaxID=488732 RepID=UPI00075319DE|nr:archease [Burkholderia diffusa]KVG25817.1 archease [Burkholderia diffusa]
MSTGWEHFPHGADIGVRGTGETLAEAFEQAALALTACVSAPAGIRTTCTVDICCNAPDLDLLLVDWLNAVIYQMATRRMLFGRYVVSIDGTRLVARIAGEEVDVERHRPAVEPKGATYTALHVGRDIHDRWVAQCVVDV